VTDDDAAADRADGDGAADGGGADVAPEDDKSTGVADELSLSDLYDAIDAVGRPHLTAAELSRKTDLTTERAREELERLADLDEVARQDVTSADAVWYPTDLDAVTDRERVVLFPDRREVVVQHADQFTRAQLSQFAHLVDTNRSGGAIYGTREEDIWQAPYDSLNDLIATMRDVFGERSPHLEVGDQPVGARPKVPPLHPRGRIYCSGRRERRPDGQRRPPEARRRDAAGPISDSESWVNEEKTAQVKRTLYDAGYPVRDERDLDEGRTWTWNSGSPCGTTRPTGSSASSSRARRLRRPTRQRQDRRRHGRDGSGGGETLILVPSRELATQWHDELILHTDLEESHIGEYHGGTKEIRPVTIATYRTAGMDRHRKLFDERRWGLIIYDEVHHVPADVYRRSADLQGKHRLGLTATPTRESDDEEEIFTLVGPPIGTDWSALFEAGFVQEPEVNIRLVPWGDDAGGRRVRLRRRPRAATGCCGQLCEDRRDQILAGGTPGSEGARLRRVPRPGRGHLRGAGGSVHQRRDAPRPPGEALRRVPTQRARRAGRVQGRGRGHRLA